MCVTSVTTLTSRAPPKRLDWSQVISIQACYQEPSQQLELVTIAVYQIQGLGPPLLGPSIAVLYSAKSRRGGVPS